MKIPITISLFALALAIAWMTGVVRVDNVEAQEESVNGIVSSDNSYAGEADLLAAKFIRQFEIISRVRIDTAVLNTPSFRSLVDFSRPIPEEQPGRANPFAPF